MSEVLDSQNSLENCAETNAEIIDRFTRSRIIFGKNFEKVQNAKVLIFGVGGVGSFALDCLYRSGVGSGENGKIVIVDSDIFEVTNQNRQIGSENVGEAKVAALARIYPGVTPMQSRVDSEFLREFDITQFDYVVDAIDDIQAKTQLAKAACNMAYGHYISSTGSAKKFDTTQIQVANIWKTHGDKFARKFRDTLKKERVKTKFKAVFSPERPNCVKLGSFSGVTGGFGLVIASEIIKNIVKE